MCKVYKMFRIVAKVFVAGESVVLYSAGWCQPARPAAQ